MGSEQTSRTIDRENQLISEIEKDLPFENKEEHIKWLDLGNFDTWATWEEITIKIIKRLRKKGHRKNEQKN